MTQIIFIFIIAHFTGDFLLQSPGLAEKKVRRFRFLLLHSVIYGMANTALCLLVLNLKSALACALIFSATHFVIDRIRCGIERKVENGLLRLWTFIADQCLHILVIVLTCRLLQVQSRCNGMYLSVCGSSAFHNTVIYILLFIFLSVPSSVIIKRIFKAACAPGREETETIAGEAGAGTLIGILERAIIAVLVLRDQYAVIGLVLTAKSIARFKKLEEQDFSEKYLIGTLMSLLIAVVATILLKELFI